MRWGASILAVVVAIAAHSAEIVDRLPSVFDGKTPVVVETKAFKLVINPDATAQSLVIKATGEEMLEPREGDRIYIGFETAPYEVAVRAQNGRSGCLGLNSLVER